MSEEKDMALCSFTCALCGTHSFGNIAVTPLQREQIDKNGTIEENLICKECFIKIGEAYLQSKILGKM